MRASHGLGPLQEVCMCVYYTYDLIFYEATIVVGEGLMALLHGGTLGRGSWFGGRQLEMNSA